jgi:hypothetical protein
MIRLLQYNPMQKKRPWKHLLLAVLLTAGLVGASLAVDLHDCEHHNDGSHHRCALCVLSVSAAAVSSADQPLPDQLRTEIPSIADDLTPLRPFLSSADSRAPPHS